MKPSRPFGRRVVEVASYGDADAAWAYLAAHARDPHRAWVRQGRQLLWWLRVRAEDHATADALVALLGDPNLSTSRGDER